MPDLLPGAEDFPAVKVLSGRVVRLLGLNPSPFTGPGTNTYLVGNEGGEPILIDTGAGLPEYTSLLAQQLESRGNPPLGRILLTHGHPDHTGGMAEVRRLFPGLPVYKFPIPADQAPGSTGFRQLADGELIRGGDFTLRAIHTPGHAADHLCFYLEEERVLFTGDVILGAGTSVIPRQGGNLADYLETLRQLQNVGAERIFPGHGPVVENPAEKIREYLEHRLERERQIITQLAGEPRTVGQIVGVIYREYPSHLHQAAGQSVMAHLDKLEAEGRVSRDDSPDPRYGMRD